MGDQEETFRGGLLFKGSQAGASGGLLAGFHLDSAKREARLELKRENSSFHRLPEDGLETPYGFVRFTRSRPDTGGGDRDGKADPLILAPRRKRRSPVDGLLSLSELALGQK